MTPVKNDKNNLVILLVVVIFIVLLIIWRIILSYFSSKGNSSQGENILLQLINQGQLFKNQSERGIQELINQQQVPSEQTTSTSAVVNLTNQEVEEIENKILEHLDQNK
jgi:hypothetical protein